MGTRLDSFDEVSLDGEAAVSSFIIVLFAVLFAVWGLFLFHPEADYGGCTDDTNTQICGTSPSD